MAAFDLFISHAREDKESVVRPLAKWLQTAGLKVRYDEFTLTLGDSLSRSIDRGLADTEFGLVILSPRFFSKNWTRRELAGLVARETGEDRKIILPAWHEVGAEDVRKFSPPLANKLTISTADGLDKVVEAILKIIPPPCVLRAP
jgi:TIR domain